MKALVISLILFALAIVSIYVNAAFIHNTAHDLKSLALSVANGESEATKDLNDYWDSKKHFVALTVGLREVDAVSEHIIKLCTSSTLDDPNAVFMNYVLLCDAIDDITRYESISLSGIL